MLPLKELNPVSKAPVVITDALIVINTIVFFLQWLAWYGSRGHDSLAARWGVVPHCYVAPGACGIAVPGHGDMLWKPLIAAMFLHGDILHLVFNMLFLAVFGASVERRLGAFPYLLFYFGCGLVASAAQIASNPFSNAPMIGASGAIAGVLGAFFILQPKSWILSYIPPIFIVPVPALLFLALWIGAQVLSVLTHVPGLTMNNQSDNIAWMAHVGGFCAGAVVGWRIDPWWKNER